MRSEVKAVDQFADVASEIEIGLAELSEGLEGEAKAKALHLRDLADQLADGLTAIYVELAKLEVAQINNDSPDSNLIE